MDQPVCRLMFHRACRGLSGAYHPACAVHLDAFVLSVGSPPTEIELTERAGRHPQQDLRGIDLVNVFIVRGRAGQQGGDGSRRGGPGGGLVMVVVLLWVECGRGRREHRIGQQQLLLLLLLLL